MHQSEIPDGIVENNACRVVVDVSSFSTIEDGRSVYKKGRTLEWWVDSEEYSIIDMEKDVAKHFGWASNQEPIFCKRKGEAAATSKPKKPSLPAKSSKRKGEAAATSKPKKSKKAAATTNTTSLAPQEPVSPGPTTRRMAASTSTPTSPGPITRRMASSTSTPTSPGPTTRRMAAQLDISPGGIARRLIIN
ncbi:unnamed protein product [Urochloa humidicola]